MDESQIKFSFPKKDYMLTNTEIGLSWQIDKDLRKNKKDGKLS